MAAAQDGQGRPFDPLRDSPLRLLGYANEVGEAFRPLIPRLVGPSYAISVGYVLLDTADKARAAAPGQAGAAAADTFLWQMAASVVLPGGTIWAVTQASRATLARLVPPSLARPLPTALGLAAIPFIVRPLDDLTTLGMEKVVRPALGL